MLGHHSLLGVLRILGLAPKPRIILGILWILGPPPPNLEVFKFGESKGFWPAPKPWSFETLELLDIVEFLDFLDV